MLTADAVLNAIKETPVQQGMHPTLPLDGDEKTGEEGDEVWEPGNLVIAKEVLGSLSDLFAENGMKGSICVVEEESQVFLSWRNTFGSRCSLSVWLPDLSAHFFSCHGTEVSNKKNFADMASLQACFAELVQFGQVEAAMEVMDEFQREYLAPLGIEGDRVCLFRDQDGSELALCWYDETNSLSNLSIWIPELDASFTSYRKGEVHLDREFTDLDTLRACFPELIPSEAST
jgi:hypothetical protein